MNFYILAPFANFYSIIYTLKQATKSLYPYLYNFESLFMRCYSMNKYMWKGTSNDGWRPYQYLQHFSLYFLKKKY